MLNYQKPPLQPIQAEILAAAGIRLLVRREDLNHPTVSGNKWWKLKYNLEEAQKGGFKKLLTFGGAYSNHILATAAAAELEGFESIGIIRGEENNPRNPIQEFASRRGMTLSYISREHYRNKEDPDLINLLRARFGDFYMIPEGGTNAAALRGCEEWGQILAKSEFDYLCLPVGTGGTMAGLIAGAGPRNIIGFSVLKGGEFLNQQVNDLLSNHPGTPSASWEIEMDYHFGGYAKSTKELLDFIDAFERDHQMTLDAVYTGKMMCAIFDMVKRNRFPRGSTVLAIHTGGVLRQVV